MARKKKPVNNTPYPDYVIETVARCLCPDIQTFFESEEGNREFEKWKAEQEKKNRRRSIRQVYDVIKMGYRRFERHPYQLYLRIFEFYVQRMAFRIRFSFVSRH